MADHSRLDAAIEARAVELDLSYVELAERAGMSDVTLRNFRKGRVNLRERNQRKLEDALGWAPGSIVAILGGGEPVKLGAKTPSVPMDDDDLDNAIEMMQAALAELERIRGSRRTG